MAFAAFVAGLVAARALHEHGGVVLGAGAWFAPACLAGAIAAAGTGWICRVALLAGMIALGAGWFTLRIYETPDRRLSAFVAPDDASPAPTLMTVEGVVPDSARIDTARRGSMGGFAFGEASVRFDIKVTHVITARGAADVSGRLAVRVSGGMPESASAGARVRITGLVSPVRRAMNPGAPDPRLWAAQRGEVGWMRVAAPDLVTPIGRTPTALERIESGLLRARAALHRRALELLQPDGETSRGRALLLALVLGEQEPEIREVRASFTRQGLAHLMAISGFHLAVMAGVALFLVRLTGERGWLEPAIVALLVGAYLLLVPARPPVMRAGLMVLALLAAEGAGRRYDRVSTLAWIGVALLVWRPMDLWSLGFQLSFGITAALLWLGTHVHTRLFLRYRHLLRELADPDRWRWWRDRLTGVVSVCLLCWAVALPTVAQTTGLVSPLAIVSTIVVLPLIVVLLWVGYAALIIGMLVPPAASWSGGVLDGIGSAAVMLVGWIDTIPGTALRVPRVSVAVTAASTIVIVYWLARGRARDRLAWAMTALIVVWLGVEMWYGTRLPARTSLRLDTFSVGDGTCHLLRSGSGALLWDCGSMSPGLGEREIPRAVRAVGGWRVPTVVITHANFDHYSALLDVVEPLGVRRVLMGEHVRAIAAERPTGPVAFLLDGLAARGVAVETLGAGDVLTLGSATITILSPPLPGAFTEENDRSLVATVEVPTAGGVRRVLLTGDIQAPAMELLMARPDALHADVLELPHHGSLHAAAIGFVGLVDPDVVVQSTGPLRAGDARWNDLREGRDWLTTALDGAVWMEFRRDGTLAHGSLIRE